jgi:RNA polymerase sigma-70 factor (ECF subfamily)
LWGKGASAEDDYTWFFRGEYNAVVRTAYLIVGDQETARDLAQEGFARLYRHWNKVSRYDRPEAWVRQVVVRLAIQHVRRKKPDPRDIAPRESAPRHLDPMTWDIQEAVASLPPMQRAAVLLFYFEDRPSSEVAQILDCSEATVRVHLHRARKRLAGHLEEKEADVAR